MLKNILRFDKIITQTIIGNHQNSKNISLNILRTDLLHEIISGNKWFKLSLYLKDAIAKGFNTIGTFGGAYSNHIIASAFAANQLGLNSIGMIRGEAPNNLSATLKYAQELQMNLTFLSRSDYKNPQKITDQHREIYWINEGGYGLLGAEGAKEILSYSKNLSGYQYIIAAAGTGTMLAGLVKAAHPHQKVIGISVMKGNFAMKEKVMDLLSDEEQQKQFEILHDFHFGGYAKHPKELIDFMNHVYATYHLPTDIVYTSKTLFALFRLIDQNYFEEGSNILMIHSGGLQGNLSLPDKTLRFY